MANQELLEKKFLTNILMYCQAFTVVIFMLRGVKYTMSSGYDLCGYFGIAGLPQLHFTCVK